MRERKCSTWIRHDVDFSLYKAVQFAEFESTINVNSTYYVLVNGKYYNPYSVESLEKLKMLRDLGHGIGIHYDLTSVKEADAEAQNLNIQAHRAILEYALKIEIKYITFHKPFMGVEPKYELITELNKTELFYPDIDNRFKYISDSGCNWRENPINVVMEYQNIHMNTHPVWWSDTDEEWQTKIHNLGLDLELSKSIEKEIREVSMYRDKLR